MKKLTLFVCALTVAALCGCSQLSKYSFINTEEYHQKAVEKAEVYATKLIDQKISELVEDKKITAEYGEELKKEAKTKLAEAFQKIDELYAKYKKAAEDKKAADTKEAAKTENK